MALLRPKFVFDVHIPSYVQSGKITQPEWKSVLKFLSSRARYTVSSITLYELIAGIEGGDDAHFLENRDRIKVLCEPAGREFLPLASDFVRSIVFKLPCAKLGLNGIDWRCLRRSCATWQIRAGCDLKSVQGQLRHAKVTTTLQHYAQILQEGQREAATKLTEYVAFKKYETDKTGPETVQ